MNNMHNANNTDYWGLDDLFGIRHWVYLACFLIFSGIVIWLLFIREGGYKIERSIKRHKDTMLVETIANIPNGAYLHRIVDKELNKVCYLNAAGGGIVCFELDDISFADEKLKKKLLKQSNATSEWHKRTYNPHNSYKNNYSKKTSIPNLNEE